MQEGNRPKVRTQHDLVWLPSIPGHKDTTNRALHVDSLRHQAPTAKWRNGSMGFW